MNHGFQQTCLYPSMNVLRGPWVGTGCVCALDPASELVFSWPAPVIFFTHGSCFVEDPSQLGSGHQVGQITDMCIHVCNVMQRNVVQCNMMPCNSQWNLKKCSKHLLENLGLAPLAPPPYKQEWDPHMAGIIPPTRTSAKSTNNILPGRRRPLKWTWHAAVILCCDFGGDP